MFNSFDQSQIDRGLYQTTVKNLEILVFYPFMANFVLSFFNFNEFQMDTESNYNDESSCGGCGSIKLGLFMDPNLNLLTVILKQAMDLVAKRQVKVLNKCV